MHQDEYRNKVLMGLDRDDLLGGVLHMILNRSYRLAKHCQKYAAKNANPNPGDVVLITTEPSTPYMPKYYG